MSDEQKWLDLALVYSKIAGSLWDKGDMNRAKFAYNQSNDCFDKVMRLRQKKGIRHYLVVC